MGGGGTQRICIDILKYMVHANYRVDLVLFSLTGELLEQIPRGINIHVVGKKIDMPNKSIECLVGHLNVNWACPSLKNKISFSDFCNHVVINWPFRLLKKFPHRRSDFVRNAHGFATYLTQNEPDCVFAMEIREAFATLIGRELCGKGNPIIWSVHNPITAGLGSQLKNFKELIHKASWVHTVSSRLKEEICDQILFPSSRVSVIYNFVDSRRVLNLARKSCGHPWLDRKEKFGHKIILTVGRLQAQKNFKFLIQSFARLRRHENLKLVIIGEGALRHTLQSQIDEHKLSDRVSMPGWTANPYAFMSRADVFVMSSNWEGFPMVLIEALACGCRIVSTDCVSGPSEVLDNGRFGRLVPANDEDAMSEAINNALVSDSDREQLVNRALEFSPENFLVQFDRLIGDTIATSRNV